MPKNSMGLKASAYISRKSAQNAFRAFDYAAAVLGTELNLYVVLRLRATAAACEATIFARVLHKFRDWHSRRLKQMGLDGTTGPLYVATFENPNDELPHVNWAVWVHPSLHHEFRRKLLMWLRRSQQPDVEPFDYSVEGINADYAKHLAKYLVKGIDPLFVDHFHLRKMVEEHGPQGIVYGKRCLVSLALNTKARNGWRPAKGRRWQDVQEAA